MNRNYFKIAWRIILKNKINTIINILGLGLGFSVSILLMIYVQHQLNFNRFHKNADRLFRFTVEGSMTDGKILSGPMTTGETADYVMQGVPGVEHVSRTYQSQSEVFVGEQRFSGENVIWADSAFFQMFSFPLLRGNASYVIHEPYTVALTSETATKYFGDQDPTGEVIRISGLDYRVTGVVDQPPPSSSMQFQMVASFSTLMLPERNIIQTEGISFPTFVLIDDQADAETVKRKIIEVADEVIHERFAPAGILFYHSLQPMKDIYLHSRFNFEDHNVGDIRNVYIFSFLAFFILLIAIFNFVNLVTAQSEKRAREIGMRKVMGANKTDLVWQFIGESVIISLFSLMLALCLNEILIGPFSSLLGEGFGLEYWNQPWMLGAILLFVILVGAISGIYPAFYLSHHQAAIVLKGAQHGTGRNHSLRKVLVSLQFTISIFLVTTLMLGHAQIRYMKNKDLGFDRENVVTVRRFPAGIRQSYESIRSELLQNPDILSVTASQSIPGQLRSVQNAYKKGDDPATAIMIHENRVQHGYLETFGLSLSEGRDFNPDLQTDKDAIIINRKAANLLGLDDPVGQEIYVWDHLGKIIGVVEDYHFLSLHEEIDPLALSMYSSWFGNISIRMRPGKVRETMSIIEKIFKEADPSYVFDYLFVDDSFMQMYQKEEQISKLITAAAVLAIILSFLGLYALTSFATGQKVREIGIRKIMGASLRQIIRLLLSQLSQWILIGNLVAWPLAYFAFNRWQENFAYQISTWDHWWMFLLAGILTGLIGVSSMLYQTLMVARTNPVESLRTE